MEFLNLYDDNGQILSKTIVRGSKNLLKNENIKLVTIWIKCKNKYLIQECSKEKGGEFAVTGGHVHAGKTSEGQACLELAEELNLKINEDDLSFIGNIYRPHAIFDVFIYENDNLDKQEFILQKEEVANVFWLTKDEIIQLINENKFRLSSKEQFEKFIK